MHIEHCFGSPLANIQYCSKPDSRAEDADAQFQEFGLRPGGQGKRTELDAICARIMSGEGIDQVIIDEPATFVKFGGGLLRLCNYVQEPRSFKTHVSWYFGRTGKIV